MPKPKVLALALAGGAGSRLELLTARRAKPALPFAGVYRLIDFPLSNCVHFHEGNADAIWRNRQLIAEHDPEVVLVLSADHVHRLDYGEVMARHRERRAGVTVVTSEVPADQAARQAVVEVAGDGRLSGFRYKPEEARR
jgi:glucose-1-phosphate adenylyltransferase